MLSSCSGKETTRTLPERDLFAPKAQIELVELPPGGLPPGFHVMVKPRGAICNLDCSYCFYLRKESIYGKSGFRMPDDVLESFTRQYIEAQTVPQVTFAWQGGEPTLMGLDFFRRAVELQQKYRPGHMRITNSFQTNGTVLDDEWAAFLKEHSFLIGLSMDGPRDIHDANRVDKGGKPTFDRVLAALRLLQKHGVEHNILCVVNRTNSTQGASVYRFFRDEGVEFIQFIPAVERLPDGSVTEWTPRPEKWGQFLCDVFEEWVRRDVGKVFVQHFDVALEAWLGMEPSLCVHAKTCGNAMALEHNGDLYSCDHYVNGEHFLGNLVETPLERLVASPFQRKFGTDKEALLPEYCRQCDVLFACNGGCPKDRFLTTPDGQPGLNYLCAGFKKFFHHVDPYMRVMASLLRQERAPAEIMAMVAERDKANMSQARRNDPCPCGSGRKYKNCCLGKEEG